MIPTGSDNTPALIDLRNHRDDYGWLGTHLDDLHDEVMQGLNFNPGAVDAIEMLLLVMPYAFTRDDYTRWEPLLYEALPHAMNLKDNDFLIRLWANLGESHLRFGHRKTATQAFNTAINRISHNTDLEDILLARIGLLRARTIFDKEDVEQFIADTLQLALESDKPHLIAKSHYMLAVTFTHRAETQRAAGHAQMAYVYWHQVGNTFEKNRALLIVAETCRVALQFKQAARYLQLVRGPFEQSYDTALYAYQHGALLLEIEQFDKAKIWLEHALTICLKLNRLHIRGATYHALGLTQIKLGRYTEAYANLRRALVIWQKIENRYQQAELVYALGYWHFRKNEPGEAEVLYRDALTLTQRIGESPLLADLQHRLQDDLSQLKEAHHADNKCTS